MNKNKLNPRLITFGLAFLFLAVFVAFLLQVTLAAWVGPQEEPTDGNVEAPLNVSSDSQTKTGEIILQGGLKINNSGQATASFWTDASGVRIDPRNDGDTNFMVTESYIYVKGKIFDIASGDDIVDIGENLAVQGTSLTVSGSEVCRQDGTNCPSLGSGLPSGSSGQTLRHDGSDWIVSDLIYNNGTNVGIGTTNPTQELTVVGDIQLSGDLYMNDGKIHNVNEIDPIFNINGKKYSTYMPDMIGQKIEVVGEARLEGDKLIIDFEKQEEGSDLWLFWQGVYRESVIPFVSPQADAEIYSYIEGSKFIIKLREGERSAPFSYRLIGTRIDHKDDKDNLYGNQDLDGGMDIEDYRQ